MSPNLEYQISDRRADILQPGSDFDKTNPTHKEIMSFMGGERNNQRRADRNDSGDNDVGLATTVANAN